MGPIKKCINKEKNANKLFCVTSRDAKTAPRMLEPRPPFR